MTCRIDIGKPCRVWRRESGSALCPAIRTALDAMEATILRSLLARPPFDVVEFIMPKLRSEDFIYRSLPGR
jgi:hypothetical protein